ncbi:MAG: hypothetical protein IIC82_03295 [Chloroflexi bacterium]|nr:hypothetical protein [Chloroflexota bacterium]
MYWCHFINLFQPSNKKDDYLLKATNQCYLPLLQIIEANPNARLTVNMDANLAERLQALQQDEVLKKIHALAKSGQIELTASGYAGTVLGVLSEEEMEQRIAQNTKSNMGFFGDAYAPNGFFPPEMAFDPVITPVVRKLGFQWMILDEISHTGTPGTPKRDRIYTMAGSPDLKLVFRDRSRSTGISYGSFKTAQDFVKSFDNQGGAEFVITGTEGDLYGMRRTGPREFLRDMIEQAPYEMLTISELVGRISKVDEASPVPGTWSTWDTLAF